MLTETQQALLKAEIARQARVKAGRDDPFVFGRTYFPDYFTATTPAFHYEIMDKVRAAEAGRRGIIIAAPRGHSKCLAGDSRVHTRAGWQPIREIRVGDEVETLGDDLRLTYGRVTQTWDSGRQPVYRVTTRTGQTLVATAEHRFYTLDGYRPLRELAPGQTIATARTALEATAPAAHTRDEVRFLAYMIAEGALSSGNCNFTNADPILVADFKACAATLGFTVRQIAPIQYAVTGGARAYLRQQGLYGHTAKTKRLPPWVFTLPRALKAELLSALWDTDGYITKYPAGVIAITLANSALIDDIRELLRALGIVAVKRHVHAHNQRGANVTFDAWDLRIGDRDNVLRFHEHVPLLLKQARLNELAEYKRAKICNPNVDLVPAAWRTQLHKSGHYYWKTHRISVDDTHRTSRNKLQRLVDLGHEGVALTQLAHSDIFWDDIEDIVCLGDAPTYDLEVAGTHNFVANGFIVHNSTLFTFLYPLWAMAYRRRRFIVMLSSSGTQAELFNDGIKKEIEQNAGLKSDFGLMSGDQFGLQWRAVDMIVGHAERTPLGTFRQEKGRYIPAWTTRLVARGAEASIRGLRSGAYRPDLILCDDLETDEHVVTAEQRLKMRQWFFRAVEPLRDPQGGLTIVVGTLLHYDSLLATLLAHKDVYETVLYRALDERGAPLWPERWTKAALDDVRAVMGSAAFNAEYMNNPLDDAERRFPPTWLRWYAPHELEQRGGQWWWRGEKLVVTQAYDLAISRRQQADLFAGATVGVTKGGDWVVMALEGGHLDFPAQVAAIKAGYARWAPDRVGVESHAYQDALRQHLIATERLPIVPIRTRGDKLMRLTRLAPFFEAGHVWWPLAGEGAGRLEPETGVMVQERIYPAVEQLIGYPKTAHDDFVDALEMAMSLSRGVVPPRWHVFTREGETLTPGVVLDQDVGHIPGKDLAYRCRSCGLAVTIWRVSGEAYCRACEAWVRPERVEGRQASWLKQRADDRRDEDARTD